jgi:GTP:adenosylcobinamide-phosphate guanylyltransferase
MSTHVIVQAGGRGSRLRHHTWNKPKCLVSVQGKPLLYHLFDKFLDAKFHIIGDYAFDKLKKYLETNKPDVEYSLFKSNTKGTCSGISDVLKVVPKDAELFIIWSDLKILELPQMPNTEFPIVFTTEAFTCRWTLNDENKLVERAGPMGIPGIFYAKRAEYFPMPPTSGEFVKWFSNSVKNFEVVNANNIEELGDYVNIELQNDREGFSRFFNKVKINETTVEKHAIDKNYSHLILKEQHWYKSVKDLGFRRIPNIISVDPYIMQRIKGQHAYLMTDLTERERRSILADYIESLMQLHSLGSQSSDSSDVKETYIKKTISRVLEVSNIIPGFEHKFITVNGLKCKNVFSDKKFFENIFEKLNPKFFTPIHGDPTFSNSLIDNNLKVWYIDPRGYFSKPGIWGDPMYDFTKIYYSAVGGYDLFNRKKFKLHIDNETVEIIMPESLFSTSGKEIFKEYFSKDIGKIETLHGLVWLSLSGYAKDDIDSVIGSFYLGLYYLEQGLKKL